VDRDIYGSQKLIYVSPFIYGSRFVHAIYWYLVRWFSVNYSVVYPSGFLISRKIGPSVLFEYICRPLYANAISRLDRRHFIYCNTQIKLQSCRSGPESRIVGEGLIGPTHDFDRHRVWLLSISTSLHMALAA